MKKSTQQPMLSLGIIFLIAGFVAQDFKLTFDNGMFVLGFIFTLSALVAIAMEDESKKKDKDQSPD